MIFNLFKSKPTLKELIPDGFVDIHSHILPGIDDGAKNIEESSKLISEMKKLGFSKIIGTPHTYPGIYDNTSESIKKSYKNLLSQIPDETIISYASEYLLEKSIVEKCRNKNLLCIKNNYVLVEMNFISEPLGLYEIIFELKINGYTPILAHPERHLFLKTRDYYKLKKVGCKFQLNLLSTTGYYGKKIVKVAEKLINHGFIDYTGSDIHNINQVNYFGNKILIKNYEKFSKILEKNIYFS